MQSSSSFALAYENYVLRGVWDAPGNESWSADDSVAGWDALADARLSKVIGTGSAATTICKCVWADDASGVLPLDLITMLDFRRATDFEDSDSISGNVSYLDAAGEWQMAGSFEGLPYPTTDFVRHLHFILPERVQARGVMVYVYMAGASSWTLGGLWAGPLWRPEGGIQVPWSTSIIDPGEMGMSRGGQGYPRLRQRRRRLELPLGNMTYEQAFGTPENTHLDLQQLGYRVGTTQPIIAFPRTRKPDGETDPHAIHRLGVYGHFTEPVRIRHVNGPIFAADARVDELL